MKSHEAIAQAIEKLGAKQVASELGVSMSLLYKWSEPAHQSGTANPLDRVADLVRASGSQVPLQWLAQQAGGVFVHNPPQRAGEINVLQETQRILKEFSDVLLAVSNAWVDSRVTQAEAETIRHEWDELKSIAETFVLACEQSVPGARAPAPK